MSISVVTPIDPSMRHAKMVCFQPFDMGKWFTLGFCEFLAHLGSGGGPNFNFNLGNHNDPNNPLREVWHWLSSHQQLMILLIVSAAVLIVGLTLLFAWLAPRGQFMFLDGVVHNRGAVIDPWKRFRKLANSVFGFRVVLLLAGLLYALLSLGIAALVALPDIQANHFDTFSVFAIITLVAMLLPFGLAMLIVFALLGDFIVPIMYLRDVRVGGAWSIFRREIAAGRVGTLILFYLMKFFIGLVIGLIAGVVACLTCCCAAIPYLGSVILLPLSVFMRCYSLFFLEQFGPQWEVFPRPAPIMPAQAQAHFPYGPNGPYQTPDFYEPPQDQGPNDTFSPPQQ